jgi:hypothetical protein
MCLSYSHLALAGWLNIGVMFWETVLNGFCQIRAPEHRLKPGVTETNRILTPDGYF